MSHGLTCPDCNSEDLTTIDSRPSEYLTQGAVRRRRMCANCGMRQTSYELMEYDLTRLVTGSKDELTAMIESIITRMLNSRAK